MGPERNEWRNGTYCKSRSIAAQSFVKARRIVVEFARRRALEREDRLLLVAHGEDRPVDGARAGAGKKLLGQKPDDLPLLRTGILRLVDQHMINALIELVMHPCSAILVQQDAGLVDQIVIVEKPALVLRPLVAGDHRISDGEERGRAVTACDGLAKLDEGQQPVRFALEAIGELGTAHLHCPGD